MSVLHKGMAAALMALTLASTSLVTATPAHANHQFWGGVAAGAIGGILLSHAVRPYPAYGYYPEPYYYRPYYRPYPVYRPYDRPFYRPYYRSYYRPYPVHYRSYRYCDVERRYDHRADVWVTVRVCPGY
ncbi:hypothetical protein [Rhizobium sullae]|uniref:hypothetical protein n=1 Tax=Rhizobium sullae TaxID=50338 RepID=UPI000B3508A7|nr:hypothetical protein [Rhizobium sullae]